MSEVQQELAQLKSQNEELMHINSEWDKEYREQEEAFHRYRYDAQQAQTENHTFIQRLKEKIATLEEERERMQDELTRYQREGHTLRERLATLESMKTAVGGVGVDKMEEEIALLRQQVKAYQEDFEAERRDKERLGIDKQTASVKYEAEITSLKLQLDRCRNDLAHYTAEASRLAQQLKLKSQYEEDKYRKHLESKGFVARSPSGLPPLDPYVEIDQNPPAPALPPRHNNWMVVPNGLVNGRDHGMVMQNGTVLTNGHDHALQNGARELVNGSTSPVRRRSANPTPVSPYRLIPRGVDDEVSSAPATVNSTGSSSDSSAVDSDGANRSPPPLTSKGRFVCPRCARRFQKNQPFLQHKDRCLS